MAGLGTVSLTLNSNCDKTIIIVAGALELGSWNANEIKEKLIVSKNGSNIPLSVPVIQSKYQAYYTGGVYFIVDGSFNKNDIIRASYSVSDCTLMIIS